MSKRHAAGRKTDDGFEAAVANLNARIEVQKARLTGETPEEKAFKVADDILEAAKMRRRVAGDGLAPDEAPAPPRVITLPPEVYRPESTRALLNAQLLECVALMRDAGWLYRNTALEGHERGYFINQTVNLMEASTKMGDAIRRLAGGEDPVSTTRHVMVVERGEGGGGKAGLENE
jgi:hypothetical protein